MHISELPSTIFVAAGAVLAAIVTGAVSFVNLVISKDQKISEFRQEWINKLLDDIAEYEGHIIAISAAWQVTALSEKIDDNALREFHKLIAEDIRDSRKAHSRIALRLNPIEHKQLMDKLDEFDALLSDASKLKDVPHIDKLLKETTAIAHSILRKEWERVKQGEFTFYWTKYSALFVFSILVVMSLYFGFKSPNMTGFFCRHDETNISKEDQSWKQAYSYFEHGDFEKAVEVTHSLVKTNPNYWYGYSYLGTLYLAMGDVKKSEENYTRAYRIFPNTENENALLAIRKRIALDKASRNK